MKDLLADLQVDDGDFSLDQLEKELATLDQEPQQLMNSQPLPALDAASLVVSHAQQRGTGIMPGLATPVQNQGMDAWSLSLQNFTAMSLQDDFLAADSARKKQQGSVQAQGPAILEGAEDYDVGEKPALTPPPGLGSGPPGLIPKTPSPKPFPSTPQNSLVIPPEAAPVLTASTGVPTPATSAMPGNDPGPEKSKILESVATKLQAVPAQPAPAPVPVPVSHHMPEAGMPAMPMPGPPPNMAIPPQMMPPQNFPQGAMVPPPMMVPSAQPHPVVVATPAVKGPAWQAQPVPPRPPPPQPIRAFCNPHPAAPPIAATVLASKFMSARDIAYVVHGILRPVLAEGISEDDYFIQFLRRLGGQANPSNPQKQADANKEMVSRANKSKEWSSEKGVLGHVAKSNVARPRALIATPTAAASSEQDSDQKQRATLWKARIYCDQAYQSYQNVVDIWRSAPPGGVPPQVQKHLVKLMKCMGTTLVDKDYKVEQDSLALLVKLSKGRTLISRVLEQALLPPNAVQALLPELLDALVASITKKQDKKVDEFSEERLFRAIGSVLQKLNVNSDTLLKCIDVVQKHGKVSLESGARMECLHTLLQKGTLVVGQDPSPEKRAAWGKAEGAFMALLQAY